MPYYELKNDKLQKFWEIHHFQIRKIFFIKIWKNWYFWKYEKSFIYSGIISKRYTKRETDRKLVEGYKLVKESNPSELKKLYSVYQVVTPYKNYY